MTELEQFLQPFMMKISAADNIRTDDDNDEPPEDPGIDDKWEPDIGDVD